MYCFIDYLTKLHQLLVLFRLQQGILSGRSSEKLSFLAELFYSVLIEFSIPMNLVRLIKMCLNKIYSKACIEKISPMHFPFKMVCKWR